VEWKRILVSVRDPSLSIVPEGEEKEEMEQVAFILPSTDSIKVVSPVDNVAL
jgi:hypothetical protein